MYKPPPPDRRCQPAPSKTSADTTPPRREWLFPKFFYSTTPGVSRGGICIFRLPLTFSPFSLDGLGR